MESDALGFPVPYVSQKDVELTTLPFSVPFDAFSYDGSVLVEPLTWQSSANLRPNFDLEEFLKRSENCCDVDLMVGTSAPPIVINESCSVNPDSTGGTLSSVCHGQIGTSAAGLSSPASESSQSISGIFALTPASSIDRRLFCPDCQKGLLFTSSTSSSEQFLVTGVVCADQRTSSRHRKRHTKPCECNKCGRRFAWDRDLKRHDECKHKRIGFFFCPHLGCDWAVNGSKGGFPRKDTCQRHIRGHGKPFLG